MSLRGSQVFELKPHAKRSVLLFLIGIVAVMFYATAISDTVGLIQNPVLPRVTSHCGVYADHRDADQHHL